MAIRYDGDFIYLVHRFAMAVQIKKGEYYYPSGSDSLAKVRSDFPAGILGR